MRAKVRHIYSELRVSFRSFVNLIAVADRLDC